MKDIAYKSALKADGTLIDIHEINETNQGESYTCPGCGKPLYPKAINSTKKRSHFWHGKDFSCNPETYLHKLAKLKFKQMFEANAVVNFVHVSSGECNQTGCLFKTDQCVAGTEQKYNLKDLYDTCELEKEYKGFVADILLYNKKMPSREPVFVEIAVTHKCDEAKIKSGIRIIEISIKNEEDINLLIRPYLNDIPYIYTNRDREQYSFYNFKFKEEKSKIAGRKIQQFKVFTSGKCFVDFVDCKERNKLMHNVIFALNINDKVSCSGSNQNTTDINLDRYVAYSIGYLEAERAGLKLKNCRYCKYSAIDYDEQLRCRLYKKYKTPEYPKGHKAYQCPYYRFNQAKRSDFNEWDKYFYKEVICTADEATLKSFNDSIARKFVAAKAEEEKRLIQEQEEKMNRQKQITEMQNKCLKLCKFYHGGDINTKDTSEENYIAYFECEWIKAMALDTDKIRVGMDLYHEFGLDDFEQDDQTPLELRAFIFSCYKKFHNDFYCEAFKKWYKEIYQPRPFNGI